MRHMLNTLSHPRETTMLPPWKLALKLFKQPLGISKDSLSGSSNATSLTSTLNAIIANRVAPLIERALTRTAYDWLAIMAGNITGSHSERVLIDRNSRIPSSPLVQTWIVR